MEPITREEIYLHKIIDKLKNGGGSNSDEIKPINLQDKTITENGTYTADDGYDGIGTVVVEVSGSGDSGGEDFDDALIVSLIEADAIVFPEKFFYYNTKIQKIKLPEATKEILAQAFSGCSNLQEVFFPEGLTSIRDLAFESCRLLVRIELPSSLTTLGKSFSNCAGMKEITFKGTPTSIAGNAFYACNKVETINVPWSEGEVANAPWGAASATINYNYTGE